MNYFTKLLKIHNSGLVKVNKYLLPTQQNKEILTKFQKLNGAPQLWNYQFNANRRFFHTCNSLLSIKDHYKTLGVSKNADKNAIKSAYIQLAKKYHPDKNRGDKNSAEKFKEVNEAYEILKDQKKRQDYDRSAEYETNKQRGSNGQTNNKQKKSAGKRSRKRSESYEYDLDSEDFYFDFDFGVLKVNIEIKPEKDTIKEIKIEVNKKIKIVMDKKITIEINNKIWIEMDNKFKIQIKS